MIAPVLQETRRVSGDMQTIKIERTELEKPNQIPVIRRLAPQMSVANSSKQLVMENRCQMNSLSKVIEETIGNNHVAGREEVSFDRYNVYKEQVTITSANDSKKLVNIEDLVDVCFEEELKCVPVDEIIENEGEELPSCINHNPLLKPHEELTLPTQNGVRRTRKLTGPKKRKFSGCSSLLPPKKRRQSGNFPLCQLQSHRVPGLGCTREEEGRVADLAKRNLVRASKRTEADQSAPSDLLFLLEEFPVVKISRVCVKLKANNFMEIFLPVLEEQANGEVVEQLRGDPGLAVLCEVVARLEGGVCGRHSLLSQLCLLFYRYLGARAGSAPAAAVLHSYLGRLLAVC